MPKQTLQQKIRRALGRFTAKRIAMILLGTAILSFGIHNIHQRTAITEGGVIGLVLLINHWLGVPASVASPLLDAASYVLAFKFLGWDFLLSAGLASVSLAGFYRIWECLPPMLPDLTPWPLAAALLAAVASVGDVPVARLLREGAFAYLLVGFLLVYNVAASGWLAGIAVALRLLLLVWASLLLTALSTPAELSEALRRLLSWAVWGCPYATSRCRFPSPCGSCRCFPRS